MNIQLFQLVSLLIYVGLVYGVFKVKNKKIKIAFIAVGLILFFVNPVRFKQEGVASLERFKQTEVEMPDRVIVKEKQFSEFQSKEYKSLKDESKGLLNETAN